MRIRSGVFRLLYGLGWHMYEQHRADRFCTLLLLKDCHVTYG